MAERRAKLVIRRVSGEVETLLGKMVERDGDPCCADFVGDVPVDYIAHDGDTVELVYLDGI